mmetsp:Transcript_9574/g.13208  ORF Transcript_9574/g.13208 Transcript_9574/m.13208 type:complete len:84 (+) Transcript_9574:123-374(+)
MAKKLRLFSDEAVDDDAGSNDSEDYDEGADSKGSLRDFVEESSESELEESSESDESGEDSSDDGSYYDVKAEDKGCCNSTTNY